MSGFTEFYAFENNWSVFIDFGNGDGFVDIYIFNPESEMVEETVGFVEQIQEFLESVDW